MANTYKEMLRGPANECFGGTHSRSNPDCVNEFLGASAATTPLISRGDVLPPLHNLRKRSKLTARAALNKDSARIPTEVHRDTEQTRV